MIRLVGIGLALSLFSIVFYGFFISRHILRSLLMLELGLLIRLLVLGELCLVRWQPLIAVILAVGVGEAGLGLRAVVKISRSKRADRVRLSRL